MNPAGQLKVGARFAAGRIASLSVALDRLPVARMFIGQRPAAVVAAVPVLYSLCSQAQGAAAKAACAAAKGEKAGALDDRGLWLEFLSENLWRLLLDWPPALGLPAAKDEFVAWRAARSGEQSIAATRALVDGALQVSVKKCLEKLVDRNMQEVSLAGSDRVLPKLNPEAWLAYWHGQVSTVPLLRRPVSVVSALHQRIAEVATATHALALGLPYPCVAAGGDGWGIGQTLTARGVLTHAVQLEENQVKKYQIWAPTDCHFTDAAGLQALTAGQVFPSLADAQAALKLAVLALDPCLPYEVELSHA